MSHSLTNSSTPSNHALERFVSVETSKRKVRTGASFRYSDRASTSSNNSSNNSSSSDTCTSKKKMMKENFFLFCVSRNRKGNDFERIRRSLRDGDDVDDTRVVNDDSSNKVLFGVPMTPEITAVALVYFVQGVIGLASLAKSYYLKDELRLEPAEAAIVTTVSSFPWLVKPLWGFISDTVPLFGYKRKSYLSLMGFVGFSAWFALSQGLAVDRLTATALFAFGALSIAFSDVLIDSIVVERARESEDNATSGSLQSLCWGMVAFGGVASSYFSGSLVEEKGAKFVFAATAIFPLLIAGAAFLVNEKKMTIVENDDENEEKKKENDVVNAGKETLETLWTVAKQKQIWGPALFMFLWQATPSPGSAMFYFSTNELHFTPEFLGRVAFARSVAALTGVGLYNAYFKYIPLKKMFTYSAILATALGSTQLLLVSGYNRQLGISDEIFALTDSAVLTVLGEISFLPVLVLAAKICPKGVEATLFASLMSLFNFGGVTSSFLGAGLTEKFGVTSNNFEHLFELVAICNFTTLLPLFAIGFLDEVDNEKRTSSGDESGERGASD